MQPEQRLIRNLQAAVGPAQLTVYQGIVASVEGVTCTVTFGSQDVSGVRLRASEAENDSQILLVPRVGTAVIVGSLSGDLSQLAVLSVDAVERIDRALEFLEPLFAVFLTIAVGITLVAVMLPLVGMLTAIG